MFEYDSQIALDDSELAENKLTVNFPNSGVLFLRHTRNTPDKMIVEINTPGGSVSYAIPVMKIQTYTIDEIFDKNLLFLIPFHIFCYESRLEEYNTDEEKLRKLQDEYAGIRKRLEELCMAGKISEYIKCTLIDMSNKVLKTIAVRYENVKKGVTSIMGGKILEYEAKTILQNGIREGERQGRIEGERQGRIEGERQGRIEGERQGRFIAYAEMVRDGLLSIADVAQRLNMNEEDVEKQLRDALEHQKM